jgi:hypothetical protein
MCEGRAGLIGMRSWGSVWVRENREGVPNVFESERDRLGYGMKGRMGIVFS